MAAISLSSSSIAALPQLIHTKGSAPRYEPSELPLNPEQKQRLAEAIPASLDFIVKEPFNLQTKFEPDVLMIHFQALLKHFLPNANLLPLSLIGSAVPNALKNEKIKGNDIDLFGVLENVSVGEKKLVEHSFLEALRLTLMIDAFYSPEPDGTFSTIYMHRPTCQFLRKVPMGQNLFKMEDFRILKGLRCSSIDDSPFYVRIPLFENGKMRDLDFTFDWKKEPGPGCFTSADCLYCPHYLPRKEGKPNSVRVFAAKGYDAQKAWDLSEKGFYYIAEEQAALLRNGLRGYARAPTKGGKPEKYSSEKVYFETWKKDYGAHGLSAFFKTLPHYLPLHYSHQFPAILAYLTNLRTIFASQDLDNRAEFLESFDRESSVLLKKLFSGSEMAQDSDEKQPDLGWDAAFLRLLGFWSHFKEEQRLDCVEKKYQTRYSSSFPSGHILAHIPWKETLELLTKRPEELQSKWVAMKPLIGPLKLPDTVTDLHKFLFDALSKLKQDPKVPLLQGLLSKGLSLDDFVSPFMEALLHIDEEDLASIQKILEVHHPQLKEILPLLSKLPLVPKEIRPQTFLHLVLEAKWPMSQPMFQGALTRAILYAKTPPAKQMAARMAAAHPQSVTPRGLERLEKDFLEDPSQNREAHLALISLKPNPPIESLQKWLAAGPLLAKEQWLPFWLLQLPRNLPTPFLLSLLESPHFETAERGVLAEAMLKISAQMKNHEAFFSCWDAAQERGCLLMEAIPSLISVAHQIGENPDSMTWVLSKIPSLQSKGMSPGAVRDFFKALSPAWINTPRNSLKGWTILQRATGQSTLQVGSLGHETRTLLLNLLFKAEDPKLILHEMIELARNHSSEAGLSILRDLIAFGKFLKLRPFYDKFPVPIDFSTLFVPFIPDTELVREILHHLFRPDYASVKRELLSGLSPHLLPMHLSKTQLESLLVEGPFPPFATLQKLLLSALQQELPFLKKELPSLLKRLGAAQLTPSLRETATAYLKARCPLKWADLTELLNLGILPPESIWEIGIAGQHPPEKLLELASLCVKQVGTPLPPIKDYWKRLAPHQELPFLTVLLNENILDPEDLWAAAMTNKKDLSELLKFSQRCLEKAKDPIPAIESFWETTAFNFHIASHWPMLQTLHDFPYATLGFRRKIIQAMENFLDKTDRFSPLLDTEMKIPVSIVPKVAEMAIQKDKIKKALDLLLAREDALKTMPLQKLWRLILSLAQKEKDLSEDRFRRLVQIGMERISAHPLTQETVSILTEEFFRFPELFRKQYESRFFELLMTQIEGREDLAEDLSEQIGLFLKKTGQFTSVLDPKLRIPVVLIPQVAELGIQKGEIDKVLDLLLARMDALRSLPLTTLWRLIFDIGKNGSEQKLAPLLKIGMERLSIHANPRETLPILMRDLSTLPELFRKEYESRFFELFNLGIERIQEEPLNEIWKVFKPSLENHLSLRPEIREGASKLIATKIKALNNPRIALSYLKTLLWIHPDQPSSPALLELFEIIIKNTGPAIYKEIEASQIWEKLAQDVHSWQAQKPSCLVQLHTHFLSFAEAGLLIEPKKYIEIALAVETLEKRAGLVMMYEYLELLNCLPPSQFPAESEARSTFWKTAFLDLRKFSSDIRNLVSMNELHQKAQVSKEHKLLTFLTFQNRIVQHLDRLVKEGRTVSNTDAQKELESHTQEFHNYFLSFYDWLAQQKDHITLAPKCAENLFGLKCPEDILINQNRLLFLLTTHHLQLFPALRSLCKGNPGNNVNRVLDILNLIMKHPFEIKKDEVIPFLKTCTAASREVEDLAKLMDQVGPFLQSGCKLSEGAKTSFIVLFTYQLIDDLLGEGRGHVIQELKTRHRLLDYKKPFPFDEKEPPRS